MSLEIDARGLKCPLPVLRARKALAQIAPGGLLRLWADDPVAVIDIPNFCRESGHEFLDMEHSGEGMLYLIRAGQPHPAP